MSDGFKRGDIVKFIAHGNAHEPAAGAIGVVTGISPMGGLVINWVSHGGPSESNKDGCGWRKENFVKIGEAEGVE